MNLIVELQLCKPNSADGGGEIDNPASIAAASSMILGYNNASFSIYVSLNSPRKSSGKRLPATALRTATVRASADTLDNMLNGSDMLKSSNRCGKQVPTEKWNWHTVPEPDSEGKQSVYAPSE